MNRIIKINCPICDNTIFIELSNDFNIKSVMIDNTKLSKEEQEVLLRKHGIEIG